MRYLKELSGEEIASILAEAANCCAHLAITTRDGNRWLVFRSRLLDMKDSRIWMSMPTLLEGLSPESYLNNSDVGMTFALRDKGRFFAAIVARLGNLPGKETRCAWADIPPRMRYLERRAHRRVAVSEDDGIRAAIWLGGMDAEPSGCPPEQPVWMGNVTNIDMGGFQLRCIHFAADYFQTGDVIGIRLLFRSSSVDVLCTGQIRHVQKDGPMCLLGVQFMGFRLLEDGTGDSARLETTVRELGGS